MVINKRCLSVTLNSGVVTHHLHVTKIYTRPSFSGEEYSWDEIYEVNDGKI